MCYYVGTETTRNKSVDLSVTDDKRTSFNRVGLLSSLLTTSITSIDLNLFDVISYIFLATYLYRLITHKLIFILLQQVNRRKLVSLLSIIELPGSFLSVVSPSSLCLFFCIIGDLSKWIKLLMLQKYEYVAVLVSSLMTTFNF